MNKHQADLEILNTLLFTGNHLEPHELTRADKLVWQLQQELRRRLK